METYSVDQVRAMSGAELVDRVLAGEEIVVTEGSVPKMQMGPIRQGPQPKRQPGTLKGLTVPSSFFEPLPEDELRRWEERAD